MTSFGKKIAMALVLSVMGLSSVLVASCVSTSTPAQAVYQAKADYEAALALAVKYRNQPACTPGTNPLVCSDPRVLDILRKADNAAEATLNNAEATVRSSTATTNQQQLAVQAAQSAVQTLVAVLQQYGVK